MRRLVDRCVLVLLATVLISACGGAKAPAAPTPSTTSVQIAASGGSGTTLFPGETRQLVATANQSNGTTLDVTSTAQWQSSNPSVASVSAAGLLTAVAEGATDITARYSTSTGSTRAEVRPTCTVTVSPSSAAFSAFGGSHTVNVTVNSPSCRWSARSDAAWFPFAFEPADAGSSSFTYTLPPNSTPSPRTASIVVESTTAQRAAHAITEDRPAGCSYVTVPDEIVFTASGGTGQFNVVTTPGDCRWNLVNAAAGLGVSITSGFSGTGHALVRYSVQAHTRSVDADGFLEVAGLSGLNPNGRHRVVILKR